MRMAQMLMISLLLAAGLAVVPARAQVGIVLTVEGQVNVISGKEECGLRYGLDLDEGDTVRTGEKSWAVLSLLDGAKITVRPSTDVRINTYRFTESSEAAQNQALLTLTRGSLRVATGAIVRGRNTGYRVRTPEVTMDMRGTDHDITHIAPQFTPIGDAAPGSYAKTHAGEAVLSNAAGELALRDGQAAFAALRTRAPPRLLAFDPGFFTLHSFIDRRAAAVADTLRGPNVQ
jgi:hypothetical protein